MIRDLLSIIIMLLIGLIGIFKDYFFKEETPRWVIVILIISSVSVTAFQISSLLNREKQEKYASKLQEAAWAGWHCGFILLGLILGALVQVANPMMFQQLL